MAKQKMNEKLLSAFGLNRKIVFLAGGLPACGKSAHLKELESQLLALYNLRTSYIDKDLISIEIERQTAVKPDSSVIYSEMLKRAREALGASDKDVVLLEGNIIGNLDLFTSFIVEQHSENVIIICLDFLCSDENQRYARMVQRAKVDNIYPRYFKMHSLVFGNCH